MCCVQVLCVKSSPPPAGEPCVLQPGVVLLQDVFAVKVKRRRAAGQQSGGAVLGVALFCCRRRGRRLEEDTLHLHNASAEHTQTWYNTLKELLAGNTHIQMVIRYEVEVFAIQNGSPEWQDLT